MPDPPRQPTAPPRNALLGLCQWLRPKLLWFWTAVVLVLILNIATVLFTTKSSDISGTLLGWILVHWPLILAVGGLFLVLTWVVGYLGRPVAAPARALPTPQDRRELIRRLSDEYRRQQTGSLQKAAMQLFEGREPAAVTLSSVSLVSWRMDAPGKASLAPPTPIVQAYDQARAGLLILGAPGVGKSTLLLELALGLLTRAGQDKEQPIPVLVNLSSWALNKPPLTTWLEDQLYLMIGIPRRLSRAWIEQNEFLLLLDGLDEMEPSARTACIAAIETYRERAEHLVRLVVCSRRDEYLTQEGRLRLLDIVEVQPLTLEQVDGNLKGGGKPLKAVRAALRRDAVLRDLVTTPLMLSVVMLAYRGKTDKDLPHLGTEKEQQRQVLEHYVTRMMDPMEKPTRKWRYPPDATRKWLIWLAQQMKQSNEFYVESLQTTWLPTQQAWDIYLVLNALVVGLVVGLITGLFGGGLDGGLLFGLFGGVAGALVGQGKIQPSEKLTWSWDRFLQWALFVGWVGGLFAGVYKGLLFGLVFGLLGGLLGGLRSTQVDEHARLRPNQGIRTSGWNALRIGLVSGLDGGLLFWLLGGLRVEPLNGLVGIGLIFALIFGLAFGGRTSLQHYCLRFVLYRSGVMPWHYVRFLEESTERILLQRVGGGYRFIHPLFQEHFASLESGTPASTQMQPSSSPQL